MPAHYICQTQFDRLYMGNTFLKYTRPLTSLSKLCFIFFQLFNSDDTNVIQEIPNNQQISEMPHNTGTLRHKLSLSSVYPNINTATTFHDNWITVDYIFYSKRYVSASNRCVEDSLQLLARYRLPSIADCCKMCRIPNEQHGSDHISLAAKFVVLPTAVGESD